jgi:peroxiredoxin
MAQFEPLKDEITKAGGQLVYIAAEKREGMFKPEKFLQEHPVSFPFLLDEDRSVTRAYGLYHRIGVDAFNIAHPATLVIDQSGMVRYIYRGKNQTDRAPVEPVLDLLRKL